MARFIKVALVGARPPIVNETNPDILAEAVVRYWREKIDRVLPDHPDLIVLPEWASHCAHHETVEAYRGFLTHGGHRVREFFVQTARDHHTHITHPTLRLCDDGSWRNSVELFDRNGEMIGAYDKNHPTIGEIEGGVRPGAAAPVFETELGRIAITICFDLNFDELRLQYLSQNPELVIFSSMYHGGVMQPYWAYSLRTHFWGACAGLPSQIYSPVGHLIATSTNYFDHVTSTINLDCRVVHLDYHREKLEQLKAKYGRDVSIVDPSLLASVLVSSERQGMSVDQMLREFDIEPTTGYFERSRAARRAAMQ